METTTTTTRHHGAQPEELPMEIGQHVLASLRGFGPGLVSLRCRLERLDAGVAFIRTADLRDAGTPLVVELEAIRPEPTSTVSLTRHARGLVALGA